LEPRHSRGKTSAPWMKGLSYGEDLRKRQRACKLAKSIRVNGRMP